MALLFKAQKNGLKSKDGTQKWHPRLIKVGNPVTVEEMGEEIAKRSSLTPGDVKNVISNLMDVMRKNLMDSRSVKLDGLGTFTVIARSNGYGVDTYDEVRAEQIHSLRVRFTPTYTRNHIDGTTRTMFSNIEFERIDKRFAPKVSDVQAPDGDDDSGGGPILNPEG